MSKRTAWTGFEWKNTRTGAAMSSDRDAIDLLQSQQRAHDYIYLRLLGKCLKAAQRSLFDTICNIALGIYIGWMLTRWLS